MGNQGGNGIVDLDGHLDSVVDEHHLYELGLGMQLLAGVVPETGSLVGAPTAWLVAKVLVCGPLTGRRLPYFMRRPMKTFHRGIPQGLGALMARIGRRLLLNYSVG